jgi:hypothetical protein
MKRLSLACLSALACTSASAVEGMWQPHQLPQLVEQLKAQGLQIDPKRISELTAHPMNAVVAFGFCTGSFVSPYGLVVTNHHCAYNSIQFNSKPEKNLLKEGFNAKLQSDELRAEPTMRILVTDAITDVTKQISGGVKATGRKRFDEIDARMKSAVAKCEQTKGYRCDVYSFHGGAQYFLVRQMEIRDVRLVYAPAEAIGKFGGDIDNWMWPRHTGDFAFYRAYVGPDQKPADASDKNVPYLPKSYLKVSGAGIKEGDFAMIAGYPGRTNRYRLAEEVADAISWSYPKQIARTSKILALIDEHSKDRPDAQVKYAGSVAGLNNGLKNFEGNLDGFKRVDVVAVKTAEEQAILEWAAQHAPDGVKGYQGLKQIIADNRGRRDRDQILQQLGTTAMVAAARDLYRLSIEREKPNAKRELGYQERDEIRISGRLQTLERRFDAKVDRAILEYLLSEYAALEPSQRIAELDRWIGLKADGSHQLKATLDAFYAGTELGDTSKRLSWFDKSKRELEASDDQALKFAVMMMPAWLRIEDQVKTNAGLESVYRPQWMNARIAYAAAQGKIIYPDANNSLRVTFGQVKPYAPRDGMLYQALSSHRGLLEKHTGVDPFDATQKQLDAIKAKRFGPYADGEVLPVNFLADLDITGGNSGSPMMNGKAELIGLAFDGNYESIASGWLFNGEVTRTIGVDARYMLWVMDAIDQADRLIEEMGLKPAL